MGQWPVFVGFTTDEAAFKRCIKRLKITDDVPFLGHIRANATTHIFERNGSLTFVITLQPVTRRQTREQVAALIAHECMHVIQEMRRELSRGGHFDDESEAYLLQHLVQHCLQEAWKTGRKRAIAP